MAELSHAPSTWLLVLEAGAAPPESLVALADEKGGATWKFYPHLLGRAEELHEDPRVRAQAEARTSFLKASQNQRRPRVLIGETDVTEDVVSVLDCLIGSLDWGSGFLDEEEANAARRLARILNFEDPMGDYRRNR